MIEVQGLKKTFGKISAVADVSFDARDGAITKLLGGNGSGKTTTLGMIAGLFRPESGHVLIDGKQR
jgi:ABC-type Na+ transport system ATPase subunit NatA